MSGRTTATSPSLDEGDDEGVSCSTRPPVLGQEDLLSHQEYEWSKEPEQPTQPRNKNDNLTTNSIIINRPDSSLSDTSPSPSSERPTQLCGQSITPNSERLNYQLNDASSSHLVQEEYHNVPDEKIFGTNIVNRPQNLYYDRKFPPDYHRASNKNIHDFPPARAYDASSHISSYPSKSSPIDFHVPGSVPVQLNCLPESDPHANLRPWLRWALAIHYLLHDANGVSLFRRYLQTEGKQHVDALEFWFAVEGLHGQITPETVAQLVKVIYRRYFTKTQLPIDDQMRRDVANKYKLAAPHMLADLFDVAQNHVETLMRQTTYPNFLKSDIYLDYVQSMQVVGDSSDLGSEVDYSSSPLNVGVPIRDYPINPSGNGGLLPTLHEDSELNTDDYFPMTNFMHPAPRSNPQVFEQPRLTKDLLLQTQKRRALEVRPKSETLAGIPPIPLSTCHAAYSGYNPVSRVDSELQSLSSHSDARTESDSMSNTDVSSIDGSLRHRSMKRKQQRQVRESASMNREYSSNSVIPRTQRLPRDHWKPLAPNDFAQQLTQKLESVLKERDVQDQFDRKLKELVNDSQGNIGDSVSVSDGPPVTEVPARALAAALKEKLKLEDDNDQDILDQHVSRVWADLTPNRSPGRLTPQVAASRSRGLRKDRDVHSTFSSDSGNVMDFTEGSVSGITGMVKSRSMDYCHENERFLRMGPHRRSSSKKAFTELTDSGVSVVSADTIPATGGSSVSGSGKDSSRVLSWLFESVKNTKQSNTVIPNSPTASRHRKGHSHSRSSSLERGSIGSNPSITQQTTILPASSTLDRSNSDRRRGEPSQPFIADPSMPPLPLPHTPTQLEEARRRLMEADTTTRNRYKDSSSSQFSLRRAPQQQVPPPTATKMYTTVVFNFCDEQFPYRTKIPSVPVTLKQFKDYLPKKGNYRYFFKTASIELDNQVIQEELSCDSDVLPLWEGKIMAQVKPID